ncbi:MAG: DUF2062 domain-containing protein [Pseudomonadota bacterium]
MFKRRDSLSFWSKVREFFAPKSGWKRALEYYSYRMKRLPDSPTRIALGFAIGAYVSFTPFFGFHFVVAAMVAWMFRANVMASAIGTFVGNPITFPFIATLSLELGSRIFGPLIVEDLSEMGFWEMVGVFGTHIHELVIPYFVGGFVPGMISAVVSFYVVRPLVESYQRRRRAKLVARAKARIAAEASKGAQAAE